MMPSPSSEWVERVSAGGWGRRKGLRNMICDFSGFLLAFHHHEGSGLGVRFYVSIIQIDTSKQNFSLTCTTWRFMTRKSETRGWLKFEKSGGSLRHVELLARYLCPPVKLLICTEVLQILEIYVMVVLMAYCIIISSKGNPRYLITKCFNPHPHKHNR